MNDYRLQKILYFLYIICIFSCLLSENSIAAQQVTIKPGDCFPNISLIGPFCQKDKKYLGLSDRKVHSFSGIRTGFVLINCFSIYCPICQKHATKFTRLHKLVQGDNFISRNMKMIGIGMGNNSKEVTYFKKYFNISFPCIADPDFKIHKALKETRTPLLAIIDKRSNPYKIFTVLDFTKEPEALIEDIRTGLHKINPAN